MLTWIAGHLRSRRYTANLAALEVALKSGSPKRQAAVLVNAAAMMDKLRRDIPNEGQLLESAVLFPSGVLPDVAAALYKLIDGVLRQIQAQRKVAVKHVASQLGGGSASYFDNELELQVDGLRLVLVALARSVDDSLRKKAHSLTSIYDASREIPGALADMKARDIFAGSAFPTTQHRDHIAIEEKARALASSVLRW